MEDEKDLDSKKFKKGRGVAANAVARAKKWDDTQTLKRKDAQTFDAFRDSMSAMDAM